MLEGKYEKLEFQKMLSSPYRKIEVSQSKTKMMKRNQEKWRIKEKKREMNIRTTKNDPSYNDKNDP